MPSSAITGPVVYVGVFNSPLSPGAQSVSRHAVIQATCAAGVATVVFPAKVIQAVSVTVIDTATVVSVSVGTITGGTVPIVAGTAAAVVQVIADFY